MNRTLYSQVRHYGKSSWRKIPLQNPDILNSPTKNQKIKIEKSTLIFVCGSGLLGSLGLPQYYKPEKTPKDLNQKDIRTKKFKRLSVFEKGANIKDIACGYGYTIVVGNVSDSEYTAFGFGLNSHSQIGYHSSRPGYPLEIVYTPSPIHSIGKSKYIKASCGRSHSLLLTDEGKVVSLGNNSFGQCGRPIKESEVYFANKNLLTVESLPNNISSIECGQDSSFFLTTTGELYSCGWGADGQTGLGHYEVESEPTKIGGDISGTKIVKVSSYADTVLALDDEGNVFGWGNTEYGQFRILANAETEQFNEPRKLILKNIPGKIIDIAAGGTMCILLNDLGDVYVWGFGILGLGPTVNQTSKPTQIPETLFGRNPLNPDVKITSVYAGLSHFAAINNKGSLFMWGKNRSGCLGFPHNDNQYFPWIVDVNLSSIWKVSLGIEHTCALGGLEYD